MPDAPRRIQRQRTKGWRMPAGAIYVGRGSRFGNPWIIGDPHPTVHHPMTAQDVTSLYADAVRMPLYCRGWSLDFDPRDVARLRGKTLACWCALDQPCHADVLLEIANAPLRCEPT